MRKEDTIKGKVILRGFDDNNTRIFNATVSVDSYYDGSTAVIDDDQYRKKKGIRRLVGLIYDYDGVVSQNFENTYDLDGILKKSVIRHNDGTENIIEL